MRCLEGESVPVVSASVMERSLPLPDQPVPYLLTPL